jgi:hypothetical protein
MNLLLIFKMDDRLNSVDTKKKRKRPEQLDSTAGQKSEIHNPSKLMDSTAIISGSGVELSKEFPLRSQFQVPDHLMAMMAEHEGSLGSKLTSPGNLMSGTLEQSHVTSQEFGSMDYSHQLITRLQQAQTLQAQVQQIQHQMLSRARQEHATHVARAQLISDTAAILGLSSPASQARPSVGQDPDPFQAAAAAAAAAAVSSAGGQGVTFNTSQLLAAAAAAGLLPPPHGLWPDALQQQQQQQLLQQQQLQKHQQQQQQQQQLNLLQLQARLQQQQQMMFQHQRQVGLLAGLDAFDPLGAPPARAARPHAPFDHASAEPAERRTAPDLDGPRFLPGPVGVAVVPSTPADARSAGGTAGDAWRPGGGGGGGGGGAGHAGPFQYCDATWRPAAREPRLPGPSGGGGGGGGGGVCGGGGGGWPARLGPGPASGLAADWPAGEAGRCWQMPAQVQRARVGGPALARGGRGPRPA